jgi:uncharacterized protein (TIGR02996 family)
MISGYANAFLGSIHDDPDDDAPRLVYADWLEEQGDGERAEFIRLQCQLERLAEDDAGVPALARRERELRRRHGKGWVGRLADLVRGFEFRRGFVEVIEVEAGQLLRYADTLFRLAPVRHLRLHAEADQVGPLADCRHLENLTALDLTLQPCPERDRPTLALGGLTRLLNSPHLARLTRLRLRGFRVEAVTALARSRHLGGLARLDLGSNHLGPEAAAGLADLRLPALADLRLGATQLPGTALRRLAGWPSLAGLTGLDLSTNLIGPDGAAALAGSPHLGKLRALRLGFNHVGDAGAGALASWPHPALERLYLARNQLGAEGVRALASSPRLAGLTHLDLDYN